MVHHRGELHTPLGRGMQGIPTQEQNDPVTWGQQPTEEPLPMKRGHQQDKYEELKVTLNGGDPDDKVAIQVGNTNKGSNEAQEQCCNENGGNNDVVQTRAQQHSVTVWHVETNWEHPRNDQVPDHHKGQYNNFSDEESQYALQPIGGKHNHTSSNCGWLCSPKAKKASGSCDGLTCNKGVREPTPKANGSKRWVLKNELALETVQK